MTLSPSLTLPRSPQWHRQGGARVHNHTYILAYRRPSEPEKTQWASFFLKKKQKPCPYFYLSIELSTLAGPIILQSSFTIWLLISRYRLCLQSECSTSGC